MKLLSLGGGIQDAIKHYQEKEPQNTIISVVKTNEKIL